MRNLFLFFTFLVFFTSNNILFSQSGWYQLDMGTSSGFSTIEMLNESTGYIGGRDTIFYTSNGGLNWSSIPVCPANSYIKSTSFVSPGTGFISTGYISNSNPTILGKTTDNGLNWDCQTIPTTQAYVGLKLFPNGIGYGVYGNSYGGGHVFELVHKTTNGGDSWFTIRPNDDYSNWFVLNDSVLFLATDYWGWVYKTTNGGLNWIGSVTNTDHISVRIMNFVNPNTGFVDPNNLNYHYISKTTNGGNSWIQMNTGLSHYFVDGFFTNDSTGYSIGLSTTSLPCKIFKTTNGGENWISQLTLDNIELTRLCMLSNNTGYAIGGNSIFKTTTGGQTVNISIISNQIPKRYSLQQNYPNPFNPSTRIKFDIPRGSPVRLKVYDMQGREVAELVNEKLSAGVYEYEWNGVGLPSGVYFYRLQVGEFIETRRMVLVK